MLLLLLLLQSLLQLGHGRSLLHPDVPLLLLLEVHLHHPLLLLLLS